MANAPIELESPIIDLTDTLLPDLLALDESVLAVALRRVREEALQPQDAVAGFSNHVD